jgi:hypothetical protein
METPHSQPPQPRNPSSRPLPDLVSFPLLDLLLSRLSRRSTFGAAHPASAMRSAGFLPLPCDGCHGCTAADGRKGVGGLLARDCCKEEQGKVPPPCVATDPVISPVAAIGSLVYLLRGDNRTHGIYPPPLTPSPGTCILACLDWAY